MTLRWEKGCSKKKTKVTATNTTQTKMTNYLPLPIFVSEKFLHPLGVGEVNALVVGVEGDAVLVVRILSAGHHGLDHVRRDILDLLQLFLRKQ